MKLIKGFMAILIILSASLQSLSATRLSLSIDEDLNGGYVDLGECKIHLKNNNKLLGKVRIRVNYEVYGKNFVKGYFLIQQGYKAKKVSLSNVREVRLGFIHWPCKGKIMIKTNEGKEYPLKYYVVSREPIQIITKKRGILNLRFHKFKYIERI